MKRSGGDSLPATERFGSFDGRIWLNTAHQGPLPLAAVEANLRLCPYLFNTRDEIIRTVEVLNSLTPA